MAHLVEYIFVEYKMNIIKLSKKLRITTLGGKMFSSFLWRFGGGGGGGGGATSCIYPRRVSDRQQLIWGQQYKIAKTIILS